jgi:hypothetical protein
MAQNETIEKSSNLILTLIFVAVFIGVMLLAIDIIIGALGQAYVSANGNPLTTTEVYNETHLMNGTLGYFDLTNNYQYNVSCVIGTTGITNATSGLNIAHGNWTQSNCRIILATNAYNNSNWNVSYSYSYFLNSTIIVQGNFIENSILGMVSNFFALAPTIGTILAVCILIAGIVILVIYVRKMKDSGSESQGYTG